MGNTIDAIHLLKVFSQMHGIKIDVNFDEMTFAEVMTYLENKFENEKNRLAANKTARE